MKIALPAMTVEVSWSLSTSLTSHWRPKKRFFYANMIISRGTICFALYVTILCEGYTIRRLVRDTMKNIFPVQSAQLLVVWRSVSCTRISCIANTIFWNITQNAAMDVIIQSQISISSSRKAKKYIAGIQSVMGFTNTGMSIYQQIPWACPAFQLFSMSKGFQMLISIRRRKNLISKCRHLIPSYQELGPYFTDLKKKQLLAYQICSNT